MPGFSTYMEDLILRAALNGQSLANTGGYLQLHDGPVTDDGVGTIVSSGSRPQVLFNTTTTSGTFESTYIGNTNTVQWTSFAINGGGASANASHWSLWTSATAGAGNCIATGALGGATPFIATASSATPSVFSTATAHGLSAGHTVQLEPLINQYIASGAWEAYSRFQVKSSPLTTTTFALTNIDSSSDVGGTAFSTIVQRYVARTINSGDNVVFYPNTLKIFIQ